MERIPLFPPPPSRTRATTAQLRAAHRMLPRPAATDEDCRLGPDCTEAISRCSTAAPKRNTVSWTRSLPDWIPKLSRVSLASSKQSGYPRGLRDHSCDRRLPEVDHHEQGAALFLRTGREADGLGADPRSRVLAQGTQPSVTDGFVPQGTHQNMQPDLQRGQPRARWLASNPTQLLGLAL